MPITKKHLKQKTKTVTKTSKMPLSPIAFISIKPSLGLNASSSIFMDLALLSQFQTLSYILHCPMPLLRLTHFCLEN